MNNNDHRRKEGLDSNALHICFVCNELPPAPSGGIGPTVLTTARALSEAGHRITVVGFYRRPYDWNGLGIQVLPILEGNGLSVLANLGFSRAVLARAIKGIHQGCAIDLIEWPDFEGLFLRNLPGTVDVVRNHGPAMSHRLLGLTKRRPLLEYFELRTLRLIPNWIGVSQWFMNEWIRISCARPIRTVVVYNPVDCDLFTPGDLSRGSNLVLYAGNLIERKGVFALARASGTFLRCLPDANLLFVGREGTPGARRTILELAGTSAAKQIRFMDAVPQKELAQIMRRAAVFAMPSILESFGNVWAEAMASGIPVVASKSSVGPEIVPHGEAGFTVDPESPAQIADAVITLMTNTDLRARFAEVGRRVALERYSLQTSLSRTLGFYRQCLS